MCIGHGTQKSAVSQKWIDELGWLFCLLMVMQKFFIMTANPTLWLLTFKQWGLLYMYMLTLILTLSSIS